ncbi:BRD4-interacting chromatin-remodeling complex-associated protein-like [Zalophus californianus]|uniref:BRD4-interacting chromatin-remodeling complex-associated protein-like n=1 Tax=Zalophus californianus TaxID=9704 RepID=A0A6J2DU54_ZALCA|nr:BRD4-interacting chromatin-remodeling complex-associated protein-like [Zalophus californianus]
MDRAPTPPSPKAGTRLGLAAKANPGFPDPGPKAQSRTPLEKRGPKGRVRGPADQAFLAAPAVPAGAGERPRSRPSPPDDLAAAPPSQPKVQTVPGYRGAARAGRGRCARDINTICLYPVYKKVTRRKNHHNHTGNGFNNMEDTALVKGLIGKSDCIDSVETSKLTQEN